MPSRCPVAWFRLLRTQTWQWGLSHDCTGVPKRQWVVLRIAPEQNVWKGWSPVVVTESRERKGSNAKQSWQGGGAFCYFCVVGNKGNTWKVFLVPTADRCWWMCLHCCVLFVVGMFVDGSGKWSCFSCMTVCINPGGRITELRTACVKKDFPHSSCSRLTVHSVWQMLTDAVTLDFCAHPHSSLAGGLVAGGSQGAMAAVVGCRPCLGPVPQTVQLPCSVLAAPPERGGVVSIPGHHCQLQPFSFRMLSVWLRWPCMSTHLNFSSVSHL